MDRKQKNYLLSAARYSIESAFLKDILMPKNQPPGLDFPAATFVTLTEKGQLRGCIGNLEAIDSLIKSIIRNAKSAAFDDYRFPPLVSSELDDLKIEISILQPKIQIEYSDLMDLISKIKPGEGLIIEDKAGSATYLPQVWQELPDKIDFIMSLTQKAELPENIWRISHPKVWRYVVESFGE